MSSSDQTALRYVVETTAGTTPTDDTGWQELRFTSEDFGSNPQSAQSEEIVSHRQETDTAIVGLNVGGGFGFDLSMDTYDDFLEALLGGTWTTDVLKVGSTSRAFSFEKEFSDLSAEKFFAYKGMHCNTLSLTLEWGAIVSGSFGFLGMSADSPASTLVGAGSSAAATSTDVMNASGGLTSLELGGSETDELARRITLNITNNQRPVQAVGAAGASAVRNGVIQVTGSIQVYHAGTGIWDLLQANTAHSMAFTLSKNSETYVVEIPNLKFEAGDPQAGGRNTDVMPDYTFRGLYDATDTALKITRTT